MEPPLDLPLLGNNFMPLQVNMHRLGYIALNFWMSFSIQKLKAFSDTLYFDTQ